MEGVCSFECIIPFRAQSRGPTSVAFDPVPYLTWSSCKRFQKLLSLPRFQVWTWKWWTWSKLLIESHIIIERKRNHVVNFWQHGGVDRIWYKILSVLTILDEEVRYDSIGRFNLQLISKSVYERLKEGDDASQSAWSGHRVCTGKNSPFQLLPTHQNDCIGR